MHLWVHVGAGLPGASLSGCGAAALRGGQTASALYLYYVALICSVLYWNKRGALLVQTYKLRERLSPLSASCFLPRPTRLFLQVGSPRPHAVASTSSSADCSIRCASSRPDHYQTPRTRGSTCHTGIMGSLLGSSARPGLLTGKLDHRTSLRAPSSISSIKEKFIFLIREVA